MLQDLKALLALREERVIIDEVTLVVRELSSGAQLAADDGDESATYRMLVNCVFTLEGTPAFSADDIPALKASSRAKVSRLLEAVVRVNGLDVQDNVKNSAAAQASG